MVKVEIAALISPLPCFQRDSAKPCLILAGIAQHSLQLVEGLANAKEALHKNASYVTGSKYLKFYEKMETSPMPSSANIR